MTAYNSVCIWDPCIYNFLRSRTLANSVTTNYKYHNVYTFLLYDSMVDETCDNTDLGEILSLLYPCVTSNQRKHWTQLHLITVTVDWWNSALSYICYIKHRLSIIHHAYLPSLWAAPPGNKFLIKIPSFSSPASAPTPMPMMLSPRPSLPVTITCINSTHKS